MSTQAGAEVRHVAVLSVRQLLTGLLLASLAACGGGGGGGNGGATPPATSTAQPSFAVSAEAESVAFGGSAVTVRATVSDAGSSDGFVRWTLEGPGRLDIAVGEIAQYLPPSSEESNVATTVKLTATLGVTSKSVSVRLTPFAAAAHTWTVERPSAVVWGAVAHGGGGFVAHGSGGGWEPPTGQPMAESMFYQSADGHSWTPRAAAGLSADTALTWGDAGWVAVDTGGRVVKSLDGTTWTRMTSGLQNLTPGGNQIRIVFGNGRYVALTWKESFVSTDGATWTRASTPAVFGSLAFGNGTFVAVGQGAVPYRSVDGLTWQAASAATTGHTTVAFGNGRFVMRGWMPSVSYSVDGDAWTVVLVRSSVVGPIAFARDRFFALGLDTGRPDDWTFGHASDATQWSTFPVQGLNPFTALAADAQSFVRVSRMGAIGVSTNAQDWSDVVEGSVGRLQAIAASASTFLAVSDQGMTLSSADGKAWKRGDLQTAMGFQPALNAKAIVHRNGRFVVCGRTPAWSYGNGSGTPKTVFRFSDDEGKNWTEATAPASSADCTGLVFDGRRHVATTDTGDIYASADGSAWTRVSTLPNAPRLRGVTFAASTYVVWGDHSYLATSADGVDWAVASPDQAVLKQNGQSPVYRVVHDGVRFQALLQGDAAVSSDGLVWTEAPWGWGARDMAVSEGQFVVVGASGGVATSRDGLQWRARTSGTTQHLVAVAVKDGRFVAVGDGSVILSGGR